MLCMGNHILYYQQPYFDVLRIIFSIAINNHIAHLCFTQFYRCLCLFVITKYHWPCSIQSSFLSGISRKSSCFIISIYSPWLRAGRPRNRSLSFGRVKNFLFSKWYRPAQGSTQPLIQWVQGALFPEVKWPEREADHSPPTSTEVKKMWIYTSTPHTPSLHSA
jgi:hypothetical protein